ncbi:MAG: NAD(P)H-binding protein, partial [Maribacter sp.]|nr:NAD(P)H-binding protein [Maribacter sp.]
MTILVVGASGATGRQLVTQLLQLEQQLKVIVRSMEDLPESWKNNERLTIINASVLELSDAEMVQYVQGCDAVASCLGHNLTFKGIYGHPRRLVTDAVRRLSNAITANKPTKPI